MGQRFWPGRYVLFHERLGIPVYWTGGFDRLREPRWTSDPDGARVFPSACCAYAAAGEVARDFPHIKDWRARRMGGVCPSAEEPWRFEEILHERHARTESI